MKLHFEFACVCWATTTKVKTLGSGGEKQVEKIHKQHALTLELMILSRAATINRLVDRKKINRLSTIFSDLLLLSFLAINEESLGFLTSAWSEYVILRRRFGSLFCDNL